MTKSAFRFVDLFAGIGGFHAALSALGGECVWASEWDLDAARIYERNWGLKPHGDITDFANDDRVDIPEHDVLTAGFPCQPFSKSGKQRGMEEARGTLFYNIAKVVEAKRPKMVLLENVRNIAGPRHEHEWAVIIKTLRDLGYRVSRDALVVSPHKIRPARGGRPQVRDRVFICATRLADGITELPELVPLPDLAPMMKDWDPKEWNLKSSILEERFARKKQRRHVEISEKEKSWIAAWDDFVRTMWNHVGDDSLPGFPIWVDAWLDLDEEDLDTSQEPKWKANFLRKNAEFYTRYRGVLDSWLDRHNRLSDFPASRRKFEWQAQNARSLDETIMHFRPSGIRAKKPNYVPALVAITQTSILGKERRRISHREAARLQGFPDWFDFDDQKDSETFRQLGNAVCVGVAFNVLRAQVRRDAGLLDSELVAAILGGEESPDLTLQESARLPLARNLSGQLCLEDALEGHQDEFVVAER